MMLLFANDLATFKRIIGTLNQKLEESGAVEVQVEVDALFAAVSGVVTITYKIK